MTQFFHSTRRNFLIRCCQSAALLPAGLRRLMFPWILAKTGVALAADFQLHPHYRSPSPLEPVFMKLKAGSDQFITEKYAQEVGEIFLKWSNALLESPGELSPIMAILAPDFAGASLRPSDSRLLRAGVIEVRQNSFAKTFVKKELFVEELRQVLGKFSKLHTAEFQVTRIQDQSDGASVSSNTQSATTLQTRIFYEMVGTSANSYREQRAGHWDLTWSRSASGDLHLLSWHPLQETERDRKSVV